ncbi:unnamed protein product [Clavelina lepadiformis]|uniref:TIR domain-containing protein n=1 Tax=Clavelina lepadiformis TaxID=159417 RepID=A0ABP0GXH2_CLALP
MITNMSMPLYSEFSYADTVKSTTVTDEKLSSISKNEKDVDFNKPYERCDKLDDDVPSFAPPFSYSEKPTKCFDDVEVASTRTACMVSQRDHHFEKDVLLVYDPEQDYYNAQKLKELIQPQNLEVVDFANERRPGRTDQLALTILMESCKYTLFVVTRNFMKNVWLKFKVDMAIQAMLEYEEKRYSVVVIVMDSLSSRELPLELRMLCPIFQCERFFEERLKKAFEDFPFGKVKKQNSESAKSPTKQDLSSERLLCHPVDESRLEPFGSLSQPSSCQAGPFGTHHYISSVPSEKKSDDTFTNNLSNKTYSTHLSSGVGRISSNFQHGHVICTTQTSTTHSTSSETLATSSILTGRVPQEHVENSPLQAGSFSFNDLSGRGSITQNSTGRRQPVESVEPPSYERGGGPLSSYGVTSSESFKSGGAVTKPAILKDEDVDKEDANDQDIYSAPSNISEENFHVCSSSRPSPVQVVTQIRSPDVILALEQLPSIDDSLEDITIEISTNDISVPRHLEVPNATRQDETRNSNFAVNHANLHAESLPSSCATTVNNAGSSLADSAFQASTSQFSSDRESSFLDSFKHSLSRFAQKIRPKKGD